MNVNMRWLQQKNLSDIYPDNLTGAGITRAVTEAYKSPDVSDDLSLKAYDTRAFNFIAFDDVFAQIIPRAYYDYD